MICLFIIIFLMTELCNPWLNYSMLVTYAKCKHLFKISCLIILQALLHSVPFGKMIVLDLFADVKPIWRTSSQLYGTPYVWLVAPLLPFSRKPWNVSIMSFLYIYLF